MDKLRFSNRVALRVLCLAWVAGLLGALVWPAPAVVLCALAGAGLAAAWRDRFPLRLAAWCLAGFALAAMRVWWPVDDGAVAVAPFLGREVVLRGTVDALPETDAASSRFPLLVSEPFRARVAVIVPPQRAYTYGEELDVTGRLEVPRDFTPEFSYPAFLRSQGIFATLRATAVVPTGRVGSNAVSRTLTQWRAALIARVEGVLPRRSAALLTGILLGHRAAFERAFVADLQATGLTHIVALSGFNISILIVFVTAFLSRLAGRVWRFPFAVMAVVLFLLLVGPSASVVRAALMGVATLAALTVGRRADPLNMLLLALAIMAAWRPSSLIDDLGLQLSFLATLGMIAVVPLLEPFLARLPVPRALSAALAATLSAQLTTFPLLLLRFGTFSIVAPLANILVVPLLPLTMALGAVLLVVTLLMGSGPASGVAAFLVHVPLAWLSGITEALAAWPLSSVQWAWWNHWWTLAAYAALVLAWLGVTRRLRSS